MAINSAKVLINKEGVESSIELPIINGTIGESGIEIGKLHKELDIFSYDPAYMATASSKSAITYIDGDAGILRYRGYDIGDVTNNLTFMATSYLLMYGDLPSAKQLTDFEDEITENMHYSSKKLNAILHAYNEDSHPMGIIVGAMSQLATHLHNDNLSLIAKKDIEGLRAHAKIAIAKMLTIVPAVARHIKNQEPIELDDKLSPVENFLYTMFGVKPTASAVIALDKLFILHADHEQNASTSAVRSVGSTGVDLFASICAGVCALWGPLHGGANEEVINMLHNISDISDVANYIEKVKKGEAKLMGFGHRVYKNYDPRASVIKKYADDVLKNINNSSSAKMLQIAMNIEQQALSEQYFIQRKLFPNVDFYSGIIYAAMGIETKMFTPMFAAGRISGWVSQWLEMVSGSEKISRPRQIYTGHVLRKI